MATDPYAAPRARVADVPATAGAEEGTFIPEGQTVPAGHGWTWITEGWALFRRQPGAWVLIIVVFVVLSVVIAIVPFLGNIAGYVLGPVFAGGLMLGCHELARGGELRLGHLFEGFRDHLPRLAILGVAYLAMFLAIFVVAFAVAGAGLGLGWIFGVGGDDPLPAGVGTMTILLAVLVALALMVPAVMAIWFAPALVVLNDFGVGDALAASFRVSLKNFVPFLVYGAIFLGLSILASIPLMLGWLALAPTTVATVYTAYRDIFYAE
jgi:uncharacterized membrane protein